MEDFNRERQLYSLAISPQFVPMMYFCEVRAPPGAEWSCMERQTGGRQCLSPVSPPTEGHCQAPCSKHPPPHSPPAITTQEGSEDLPPFVITERGDFTLAEVGGGWLLCCIQAAFTADQWPAALPLQHVSSKM